MEAGFSSIWLDKIGGNLELRQSKQKVKGKVLGVSKKMLKDLRLDVEEAAQRELAGLGFIFDTETEELSIEREGRSLLSDFIDEGRGEPGAVVLALELLEELKL